MVVHHGAFKSGCISIAYWFHCKLFLNFRLDKRQFWRQFCQVWNFKIAWNFEISCGNFLLQIPISQGGERIDTGGRGNPANRRCPRDLFRLNCLFCLWSNPICSTWASCWNQISMSRYVSGTELPLALVWVSHWTALKKLFGFFCVEKIWPNKLIVCH